MPSVIAYGCDDATTQFHPLRIDIREPGEGEIYFDVAYAGICHSDIHSAHGVIPQVEMITGEDITQAYDNVVASRVRYRYVIDTSTFPETA